MSKLDIAKEWLAEKYTALHGSSRSEWPMDSYHRDLGLLIDFVTDCWPSAEIEKLKAEKLAEAGRVVAEVVRVINECRAEGETDLRCVRSRVGSLLDADPEA